MPPPPSGSFRFEALDGWRGLAALAICFYHVPVVMPLQGLARWENTELMVDLFLVLSGFVIAHAWGERIRDADSAATFLARRFWRIMPMHVAMLLVLLGLEIGKLVVSRYISLPMEAEPFTQTRGLDKLLANLFLVQALNLHGMTSWNAPAWSISVEFWTYLVFALVMLLARRRAMLAFVVLSAAAVAVLAVSSPRMLLASHDWGLFRAIYDFFIGAFAYHLFRGGSLRFSAGPVAEVASVAGVVGFLCLADQRGSLWAAPLVFAMLVVVFAQSRGPVQRMLESRGLQALGLWSYSLYMLHDVINYIGVLVAQVAARVFGFALEKHMLVSKLRVFSSGSPMLDFAAVAVLIALSVFLSRYTWRYIERPFLAAPTAPAPGAAAALRHA